MLDTYTFDTHSHPHSHIHTHNTINTYVSFEKKNLYFSIFMPLLSFFNRRKCSEKLEPFRLLPATYRTTNKPTPTKASFFIAQCVAPLRAFVSEESARQLVAAATRTAWVHEVLGRLTDRYVFERGCVILYSCVFVCACVCVRECVRVCVCDV